MKKILLCILGCGDLLTISAVGEPDFDTKLTAAVIISLLFLISLVIIVFAIRSFRTSYSRVKLMLISLVLGLCVITAGMVLYRVERNELLDKFYREIEIIATEKVNQVEHWRVDNDLTRLTIGNPRFVYRAVEILKNPLDSVNIQLTALWSASFADHHEYDNFAMLDSSGQPFVCLKNSYKTNDYEREFARLALTRKKAVFSNIYRSDDDSLAISVFIPVTGKDADSLFKGVLHFRKSPKKYLLPLISYWPSERKSAETLLYTFDNDSAYFISQLRFKKNSVLTGISLKQTEKPVVKAILGFVGRVEGIDYRDVEVLAVSYKIPDSNWGIVAKIDKSEYDSELHFLQFIIASISIFLSLLSGFIMYFFVQIIRRKNLEREIDNQLKLNQMSNELVASEEKYRHLFDAMPVGCALHEMVVDENGKAVDYRFLNLNPVFEKLTGLKESVIVNRTLKEVLPESEYQFIDFYAPVALEGKTIYFEQYSAGLNKHFEIFAYSPQKGMFVTMFNDISLRKEAEEKIRNINTELEEKIEERTADLRLANKELESFSYSVSHDLRAPLRAIEGFSTALFEDYNEKIDQTGQDYLQRIRKAANHMSALIDDFLNLSRISRKEMEFTEVDLSRIVTELADNLKNGEPERKIELIIQPGLFVTGDIGMMTILMNQFLTNAFKFTKGKDNAIIQFKKADKRGNEYFCLEDNGAGFDPAYAEKLFIPFQRLHSNIEFPGTGIGLAIAQRIIAKHGGELFAEGELNKGARFYFKI